MSSGGSRQQICQWNGTTRGSFVSVAPLQVLVAARIYKESSHRCLLLVPNRQVLLGFSLSNFPKISRSSGFYPSLAKSR